VIKEWAYVFFFYMSLLIQDFSMRYAKNTATFIIRYINNYRFAINKYFVVHFILRVHSFINAISDEIRGETINSTFNAQKHGAFIRFNVHFLSDATKV
jgi:hypothetical protein